MDRSYQTEQMLIQDLKKSSRKAFNEIYAMYAKRLYAYCLQYSKSVEDAEDIVQATVIRCRRYAATSLSSHSSTDSPKRDKSTTPTYASCVSLRKRLISRFSRSSNSKSRHSPSHVQMMPPTSRTINR